MRRTSTMTLGFVLIFFGIQLALVDSYLLTPRISNFLSERGGPTVQQPGVQTPINASPQSPFTQAAYRTNQVITANIVPVPQKRVSPPKWLCWPVLFCGTVVLLQGISMPRR